MKNMPIGAIKPKEDEEEVQNIDRPSSSNVSHDDERTRDMQMKIHLSLMNKQGYIYIYMPMHCNNTQLYLIPIK
jgi:hypothetical protein